MGSLVGMGTNMWGWERGLRIGSGALRFEKAM